MTMQGRMGLQAGQKGAQFFRAFGYLLGMVVGVVGQAFAQLPELPQLPGIQQLLQTDRRGLDPAPVLDEVRGTALGRLAQPAAGDDVVQVRQERCGRVAQADTGRVDGIELVDPSAGQGELGGQIGDPLVALADLGCVAVAFTADGQPVLKERQQDAEQKRDRVADKNAGFWHQFETSLMIFLLGAAFGLAICCERSLSRLCAEAEKQTLALKDIHLAVKQLHLAGLQAQTQLLQLVRH